MSSSNRHARVTLQALARQVGITRLAFLTHYDSLGIPVASAVHPNVHSTQITAHQGKGLDPAHALLSAIMESVERYAAARVKPARRATAAQLAAAGESVFTSNADGRDEQLTEWVEAARFPGGKRIWVPMERVAFPYFPPPGIRRTSRPSTTGLSAHETRAQATAQGLLEVLERDAVRRFREGEPARRLKLNTVTEPDLRALISRFEACGIVLWVVDLSPLSSVPAFLAYSLEQGGFVPNLPICGQGAHFNPAAALRSALLEVAQSRIAALQASREDFYRHKTVWNSSSRQAAIFVKEIERGLAGTVRWDRLTRARPLGMMDVAKLLYREQGARIAVIDLSAYSHGIPAVRVCIEGMRDAVGDAI